MNEITGNDYTELLQEIIVNIENARVKASKLIYSVINEANYNTGKIIIERQQKFGWGQSIPEHLLEQANESLKSSYYLDFFGITKPVLERKPRFKISTVLQHNNIDIIIF